MPVVLLVELVKSQPLYTVSILLSRSDYCIHVFTVGGLSDVTVELPSDHILPQTYTMHVIKAGNKNYSLSFAWYYEPDNTSSTEITAGFCSWQLGYKCSIGNGTVLHQSNETIDYTLTVTWYGESTNGPVLSQSENGDHRYRFFLRFSTLQPNDTAERNRYITVTGNLMYVIEA